MDNQATMTENRGPEILLIVFFFIIFPVSDMNMIQ